MLKLSSAYGAKWHAAFGDRDIRYNEKIWSVVAESNAPDETLFSLIDKSDGSSFLIRVEAVEGIEDFPKEALEESLAESISDPKFSAERISGSSRGISGVEFTLVRYHINNPKFGAQVVVHAFAAQEGEAVILMLSWPRELPTSDEGLPVKFQVLMDGISLRADG